MRWPAAAADQEHSAQPSSAAGGVDARAIHDATVRSSLAGTCALASSRRSSAACPAPGRRGVRRRHARARRRGPGVILLIHHLNPQPAAAVPGREEVGAVHLVVTYQAKKRGVSGAVHRGHAPAQLAPGATTAALAVADLHYRLQEAGLLCHSVEHLAGVCVALYYRAKQGHQSPREGEMAMATGGRRREIGRAHV